MSKTSLKHQKTSPVSLIFDRESHQTSKAVPIPIGKRFQSQEDDTDCQFKPLHRIALQRVTFQIVPYLTLQPDDPNAAGRYDKRRGGM